MRRNDAGAITRPKWRERPRRPRVVFVARRAVALDYSVARLSQLTSMMDALSLYRGRIHVILYDRNVQTQNLTLERILLRELQKSIYSYIRRRGGEISQSNRFVSLGEEEGWGRGGGTSLTGGWKLFLRNEYNPRENIWERCARSREAERFLSRGILNSRFKIHFVVATAPAERSPLEGLAWLIDDLEI